MSTYPVASGHTSKSGLSIPEKWSKRLFDRFLITLIMPQITNTDYEGEIKDCGDTVIVRKTPDITIRDYKVGEDLTYDDIVCTTIKMVIDKAKYYGLSVEDLEQHMADVPYVQKTLDEAARSLKEAVEKSYFGSIYGDADSHNCGATAGKESGLFNLGTSAAPVELDKKTVIDFIVDCGTVLDEQQIPRDKRFFVAPPWFIGMISKAEIEKVYITGDAPSALRVGNVGKIADFNLFQTTFCGKDSSSLYHPVFGHTAATSFATAFAKQETATREKRFGKVHRGLNVYGWKTFHPEALGSAVVKRKTETAASDTSSGSGSTTQTGG